MAQARVRRVSGKVVVEISFDRRARVHPRLHGAYRARILEGDVLVDALTIGIPRMGTDGSQPIIDEIAETAIRFTLGDHPDLPIDRDANGAILMSEGA
jgi:hypothetical protein